MKLRYIAAFLMISSAPLAANAMPKLGDMVGTNPTEATAALEKAGCKVSEFEPEGGRIEAKCADADGKKWEVYIDPEKGTVAELKNED